MPLLKSAALGLVHRNFHFDSCMAAGFESYHQPNEASEDPWAGKLWSTWWEVSLRNGLLLLLSACLKKKNVFFSVHCFGSRLTSSAP